MFSSTEVKEAVWKRTGETTVAGGGIRLIRMISKNDSEKFKRL